VSRPTLAPRPTLYKGILMRSRLEADYARYLDQWLEGPWQYEPRCFADERGQYLPDFQIDPQPRTGHPWYLEVKPAGFSVAKVDEVLDRMAIVWSSEPTATLELVLWRYQADAPPLRLICHGCVDHNSWLTVLDGEPHPRWFWSAVKATVRWPS
jgi:hypothetical protein